MRSRAAGLRDAIWPDRDVKSNSGGDEDRAEQLAVSAGENRAKQVHAHMARDRLNRNMPFERRSIGV